MAISVTDNPGEGRFEAHEESGGLAGFVTYEVADGVIAYIHTEVTPAYEGKGVGSLLARSVMDDARAKGRRVVAICPFLAKWLSRHQEYGDIVVPSAKRA